MRIFRRLLPLALLALVLGGCRTTWSIESRDTPVHVWLTSTQLAACGGMIQARVTVGPHVAVDGPVRFLPGVPNVKLAPLRMAAGTKRVDVSIDGGRLKRCVSVGVSGATWIRITIGERSVQVEQSGREFTCPREGGFPIPLPGR